MNDTDTPDGDDGFEAALAELIERAVERDVTVESAWEASADGSRWDVQISRVADGSDD